jgi:hypothetical protein
VSGDRAPVVAAVRQLPGVSSAEADYEPSGAVTALRVGLSPGVDRLAVEAAVRRVSRAHFGAALDRERVRIVDVGTSLEQAGASGGRPQAVPATGSARLRILCTDVTTAGGQVTARVVLSGTEGTTTGLAHGVVGGGGVRRAVATATLRALDSLLPEAGLTLDHVQASAQDDVVLVRLSLIAADGEQALVGAALVRHDESDAVVRATLDAVNRLVGALRD